jgi:transcriptional regulator with XRE-family HTH domain
MPVIERLRAVRKTLNVSQKVFAKSIFVSTSHYACMETGHRKIKASILDSITKIYNVNREWLATGKGGMFDSEPPDVKLEELIGIFKRLNGHFKQFILDQVKKKKKIQEKELEKHNSRPRKAKNGKP